MWKLHHIGWIVKDIEEAKKSLGKLIDSNLEDSTKTLDYDRDIEISFISLMGEQLELIRPLSQNSPVFAMLKREGPCLYHLCFEVDDIDSETDRLIKNGVLLLHEKKPSQAISGREVSFFYDKNIGIIELVAKK